jgi:hypothetical protein
MDIFTSFIQILLPGSLVLMGIYLTIKTLVENDYKKKALEVRSQSRDHILPLRLQAYERVVLLLERTSPHNLVLRVNYPVYNAAQLQQQLLHDVREELAHNLSQQIYLSAETWSLAKRAIEETIAIINTAAQSVDGQGPGLELARAIFAQLIQLPEAPNEAALRLLKSEVEMLF